ncbi:MAG: hypothetical protein U0559_13110 [Anaerolineae bacterium]
MKLFKRSAKTEPSLTQAQQADTEREQRVASREPIGFSYTVFWTKTARAWDAAQRSAVARQVEQVLKSPEFQANSFNRKYSVDGVEGAHAGASLIALSKVLKALNNE